MTDRSRWAADLVRLGVAPGDLLLIHSSFKALKAADGTPADLLAAVLEVLGARGTLLLPSFQRGSEFLLSQNHPVWDVRNSPSELGVISETFRKLPGVIRSLSPTHCMAALGPRAAELLAGHERCRISVGLGSPFHKFIEAHGKLLLLGVGHGSDTMLHFVENTNGAPTICRMEFDNVVIAPDGRSITVPTLPHMPGLPRRYSRVDADLDAAGLQRRGTVGAAECRLVDADGMARLIGEKVRRDPCYLIEPMPGDWLLHASRGAKKSA